jgi:hypothetical protein
MFTCKFCGSELPEHASFCGHCGRTPGDLIDAPTRATGLQVPDIQDADTVTTISMPGNSTPVWEYDQRLSNTSSSNASEGGVEEDEEEQRRRAAMPGLGVPLLGGLAVEGQPYAGSAPVVQGTPQMQGVPTVQGTPQLEGVPSAYASPHLPGGSVAQGFYANPTVMAPQLAAPPLTSHLPDTTWHHPHHPHHPQHQPQGCSSLFIIVAISIPILLILSFIGLGLTVLAPGLSLSGASGVVQGGTFNLHGTHFIPGSSVSLTLDDTTPLYFTSRNLPALPAFAANVPMQVSEANQLQAKLITLINNTVFVGGDGTFDVTITASTNWSLGKHTIKASESVTHRSAQLDFTIYAPGTAPTPTSTDTATPSGTASPAPTTTLTPTASTPGLSCVNPSSLTLGPVSQGYNQPVSAQVTLCTNGTGSVNWAATWDQNAASWLQLDHSSGQIPAPGQAQVNVSALATNLTPGTYSTTLTFTGQPNNVTESLPVSVTVQAGCVSSTPKSLSFSGVTNVGDPAPQTVAITNCGPVGAWSASAQTSNGANWLFVSPTTGTMNAGANTSITISASNLKAQLAAGTYTGSVTFKLGTGTTTVNVTLTVQPAPSLSATPTLIFANRQCKADQTGGHWLCYVSLTNTSTNLSVTWSASSSGINGIIINPSRGMLSPGQTISVQIAVPISSCPTKGIVTFTGPGNAVNVEWYCILG